jgi:predicted nuclease of predicted toxin-antitoxin system
MDVVTVQERQGEGTGDADVLAEALRDARIVLTNDTDFLVLAARHTGRGEPFAPIYFWPQNRRRVGELVRSIIREASRGNYAAVCSQDYFV